MNDTDQTSREGIHLVGLHGARAGMITREQPISDFGIDVHLETKDSGRATGRLIAAQVKAGSSWLSRPTSSGFWHPISQRHYQLWTNHSLPVIVVLCDIEHDVCYWELVTPESCIRVGESWKIEVPKANTLSPDNVSKLIDIASPVGAASDYTIVSERDQMVGQTRRVRLEIVIHSGLRSANKPHIAAIARDALQRGRQSDYARDEISAAAQKGRPVDVVWGWIYTRELDISIAAWRCHFQWISPSISPTFRPTAIDGEPNGDGLVLEWRDPSDLVTFVDARRISKSEYLRRVDALCQAAQQIQRELSVINQNGELNSTTASFPDRAIEVDRAWDGMSAPPAECVQLNESVGPLLATIGNAGLIWQQASTRSNAGTLFLSKQCLADMEKLLRKIEVLREAVR